MTSFILVDDHVSVLGPEEPMLGPIQSGSIIIARTAPGCWGPMITPNIIGGHEVTKPIAIDGAEPGDAVVIKIQKINVLSVAATSGTDRPVLGRYNSDPGIDPICPNCNIINPKTVINGIGPEAVRCASCGKSIIPFEVSNGYTMVFDDNKQIGITVSQELSKHIAEQAYQYSAIPKEAKQIPSTILNSTDIVGLWSRLRPFVGNIGASPSIRLPAAKNSCDLALRMVGAAHDYSLKPEDIARIPDGHLDSDQVREGSVLIVPVKIPGAGIYLGDVHAVQGDGEIAGHTVDVTAETTIEVQLLKNINLEGPILLPVLNDLPNIVRPLSIQERSLITRTAKFLNVELVEDTLPIQVIGTGIDLNNAVEVSLKRMAKLTGLELNEVKNRCTIAGAVEIARLSGVVQLSMLVPVSILDRIGIYDIVKEMYQSN